MEETCVYAPGGKVKISDGSTPALINCVAIYANGGILYDVVWWVDGTRQSAWLNEEELEPTGQEKVKIGFKQDD